MQQQGQCPGGCASRSEWRLLRCCSVCLNTFNNPATQVAGGGVLLAAGRLQDPLLSVGCDPVMVWSLLVPLSHLALLRLAPQRWYRDNRCAFVCVCVCVRRARQRPHQP